MKSTNTSFLLFFSLTQVFSQSPYSLDTNSIDITFGNYGRFNGNEVVQVTNVDTIEHLLTWEIGTLPEGIIVRIVDGILTYNGETTTICGNSIAPFTKFGPNEVSPLGIYSMDINNIEEFVFPLQFQIYIVDYNECSIKLDSINVTLHQATSEEYDISFDKEEIDLRLNESTGMIDFPHEELRIFNTSEFSANLKWRINAESLPEEILFLIDYQSYYSLENKIGEHSNCNFENDEFIANPSLLGKRFYMYEVDVTSLNNWDGFPYQFTVDLMLLDCETVLDSVVVNLLNGTTSNKDYEQVHINIYPNPVSDVLFVDSDIKISKIRITDIKGQLQFEALGNRIDISELKAGVYFASIMDQEGNVVNRKFIVE